MLSIFDFIEENVIGGNTKFEGPYGDKKGKRLRAFFYGANIIYFIVNLFEVSFMFLGCVW